MTHRFLDPTWFEHADALFHELAAPDVAGEKAIAIACTPHGRGSFYVRTYYPSGVQHFVTSVDESIQFELTAEADVFDAYFAAVFDGGSAIGLALTHIQRGTMQLHGDATNGFPAAAINPDHALGNEFREALAAMTDFGESAADAEAAPASPRKWSLPPTFPVDAALLDAVPSAVALLEEGFRERLHSGASIYVAHDGQPVFNAVTGWATDGAPTRLDALYPWLCCTKIIGALVFDVVRRQAGIEFDDEVRSVVPEFTGPGKDGLTFRHLLTHTTGVKSEPLFHQFFAGRSVDMGDVWNADFRAAAPPGTRADYSLLWAWMVLGEAVERLSSASFADLAARLVLRPLGLDDTWLAMASPTYARERHRLAGIWETNATPPEELAVVSSEWFVGRPMASSSAFGTVRDLGVLVGSLLPGGRGDDIYGREALDELTQPSRGMLHDPAIGWESDWGLGIMVGGAVFSDRCGPRTFGHTGFGTTVTLGDPAVGLTIAVAYNGMTLGRRSLRDRTMIEAVYDDLGVRP